MAHKHSVYDSDTHFSINPVTRTIRNESSQKTTLIQYDHNSERFTFEIPRHVEGHDMSICNVVEIHYLNIEASTKVQNAGVYEVADLQICPEDDEFVILSWLISQNATQLVGSLNFLVRFACVTDGVVDYVWNTAIHSGIAISSGIHNDEIIVEQYADVLEQWRTNLAYTPKARVSEVTLLADRWLGENHPYYQVVQLDVTPNSQVDLTPSVEQLAIFYDKSICFVTENDGGVVTVYAIGQKPMNDYTIQVTITEVEYE